MTMDLIDIDPKHLQRLFLQFLLYKPFIRDEVALSTYEQCCKAVNQAYNPNHFPTFLNDINARLDELNLAVRQEKHHFLPISYTFLVNLEADEISKLATSFKPAEIAVFRELIDLIVTSEAGYINSVDILNLVSPALMSKHQFETTVLHRLTMEGWLEEISQGLYTIGVRTLFELKSYIEEQHPDLDRCTHCENTAIMKIQCPNCSDPPAFFHGRCLDELRNRAGDRLPCPKCRHQVPYSQSDYPPMASDFISSSQQIGRPSMRKRARLCDELNEKNVNDDSLG